MTDRKAGVRDGGQTDLLVVHGLALEDQTDLVLLEAKGQARNIQCQCAFKSYASSRNLSHNGSERHSIRQQRAAASVARAETSETCLVHTGLLCEHLLQLRQQAR